MIKKLLCGIGLSVCVFTACQQTPSEDVVVNKNDNQLQEIIADTSEETVGETKVNMDRFTDNSQSENGDILFNVNAQIVKHGERFPVMQAVPHEITSEDVKQWADVMFEGAEAFEPSTQYSKSELEKVILSRKSAADIDRLIAEYGDNDMAYDIHNRMNEQIAVYEEMYADAPDTLEKKSCDWEFHPSSYYDRDMLLYEEDPESIELEKTEELKAVTDDLGGYSYMITAYRRSEDDYRLNTIEFERLDPKLDDDEIEDVSVSQDEIIDMVEEKLSLLGLSDWKLWENSLETYEGDCSGHLLYTRTYGDVDMLVNDWLDLKSTDTYAANYENESLDISIKEGKIRWISYTSPMDIVKTENENVKSLPFDEIYKNFKVYMENRYPITAFMGVDDSGEASASVDGKVEIKVSEIRKGMFRIREKDTDYSFLLVPTWVFSGQICIGDKELDEDSYKESEVTELCYINAIDGSIIDPGLGY